MNQLARKEPVMMRGSGGAMDYHVFAHKGRFGLGFKMLGMSPGAFGGVPDSVHYAIRIRAAKLPEGTYTELANQTSVVNFGNPALLPSQVFPQLSYDKGQQSEQRASAILAGFFKPDFSLDAEQKLVGADDIRSGVARQQFLDYMKKVLEDQTVVQVMTDDEVLETMQAFEQVVFKKVWESLLTQAVGTEVKAQSTGVVGSQADLAVKIKKKMQDIDPALAAAADEPQKYQQPGPSDEIIDPDAGTEPDSDEDGEGDDEDEDEAGDDDDEGLDNEDEDK